MLIQNLGFVGADFTNYFVLVQAYGSGNPHYIGLIRKETGKNLLKPGAAWIDADEKKEYLLYSDVDVPKKKDKMILLNIGTGVKQYFNFPEDIFEEPGILYRIESSSITEKKLVIKYSTQQGEKTKSYNR